MGKPDTMSEADYKYKVLDHLDSATSKKSNLTQEEVDAIETAREFLERWWEV